MSYSLNSLKRGHRGEDGQTQERVIKGLYGGGGEGPKIRITFLGVVTRTIVFGGPLIQGNYHMGASKDV